MYQPNAKPLTKDEEIQAFKGQILYPQIIRQTRDPVILDQKFALVSFLELPEKVNGVTHFVKIRGVYEDEKRSEEAAKEIIKNVDSKYKINISRVGVWTPVSEDSRYDRDTLDVGDDEDYDTNNNIQLNDEAVKQAEKRHNKIKQDLMERAKKLLDPEEDLQSDEDSLKYFTMKIVGRENNKKYVKEQEKKLETCKKTLETFKNNVEKTDSTIKKLLEKHPEYETQWIELYNKERSERGFPPVTGIEDIFRCR